MIAADGGIKGIGVPAGDDQTEMTRITAPRPLPLHPDDPVCYGQRRFNEPAELRQHAGEKGMINSRPQVPLGLAHPRDTTEHILHPQGEEHHAVRLDLGEVDDDIGIQDGLGQLKPAEGVALPCG